MGAPDAGAILVLPPASPAPRALCSALIKLLLLHLLWLPLAFPIEAGLAPSPLQPPAHSEVPPSPSALLTLGTFAGISHGATALTLWGSHKCRGRDRSIPLPCECGGRGYRDPSASVAPTGVPGQIPLGIRQRDPPELKPGKADAQHRSLGTSALPVWLWGEMFWDLSPPAAPPQGQAHPWHAGMLAVAGEPGMLSPGFLAFPAPRNCQGRILLTTVPCRAGQVGASSCHLPGCQACPLAPSGIIWGQPTPCARHTATSCSATCLFNPPSW